MSKLLESPLVARYLAATAGRNMTKAAYFAVVAGVVLMVLLTIDPEYYKKFMSVNLNGALWCTRAVYKKMSKRGGGAIVNQSSTAAWVYSNYYGLAKTGINGLTQQLSRELGGRNIRINAIAPGPIDTEVVELSLSGSRWDIRIEAVREAIARLRALVEQQ